MSVRHDWLHLAIAFAMLVCVDTYAARPDFYADVLKSDGVGGLDTGYKNKRKDYPKTSRIEFSFYSGNGGKGEAPGPVAEGNQRSVFGYVVGNDNKFLFRYDGLTTAQIWFAPNSHKQVNSAHGDVTIELDQEKDTAKWGAMSFDGVTGADVDTGISYYIFSHNSSKIFSNPSVIDFKSMKIYEISRAEGEESLVRHYRPCYIGGKVAVHEVNTDTIIYPSSDGFTIYGYDIDLAAGSHLAVSYKCASPRSLKLDSGAVLEFDGDATLSPEKPVSRPDTGKVIVSLVQGKGKGRYVLMDNLPDDYNLSVFELGSLPHGNAGLLSKEGTSLVLTLRAETGEIPDAIAASVRSDGHGYFDTGYKYRSGVTSRISFDFFTADYAKGSQPGPIVDDPIRSLMGYQKAGSGNRTIVRYSEQSVQIWYENDYKTIYSGVNGGDMSFELDYGNNKIVWGDAEFDDASWGNENSSYSYYIFAVNLENEVSRPSVFDFYSMKIYEKDGENEKLVCDFMPCVKDGRAALFDNAKACLVYPAGDTNGFTAANAKWRLNANGETLFASGNLSIACSGFDSPKGWVLIRDFDGAMLYGGDGVTANFSMPECTASLVWVYDDRMVDAADTAMVDGVEAFRDLTLNAGSELEFARNGMIYLTGNLNLPESGEVKISYNQVKACGSYTLLQGIPETVSLSRFTLGALPEGFSGMFERHGNRLVLKIVGEPAELAGVPDALSESVRSDGHGYFDTGYAYCNSEAKKTSRILFDFKSSDYGKGSAPGPVVSDSNTQYTIFGYQNSTKKLLVRYQSQSSQIFYDSNYKTFYSKLTGDILVDVDFQNKTAKWADSTVSDFELNVPERPMNFYVFALNNDRVASKKSVFDFKSMKIYETDGANEKLVHDFLPCWHNGRAGMYDATSRSIIYPTGDTNGFAVAGLKYPSDIYGPVATQEFARIISVSPRAVRVPEFTSDDEYVFIADGRITAKANISGLSVLRYGHMGELLSVKEFGSLAVGYGLDIEMQGAAKAVVRIDSTDINETIVSGFDAAEVAILGYESEMNVSGRRSREFFLVGDAEFVLKAPITEAIADMYDADGTLLSSSPVSGPAAAGTSFTVDLGSASHCVVRMTLAPPGLFISIR